MIHLWSNTNRARNIDSCHKFYIPTQGKHDNIFNNNTFNKKDANMNYAYLAWSWCVYLEGEAITLIDLFNLSFVYSFNMHHIISRVDHITSLPLWPWNKEHLRSFLKRCSFIRVHSSSVGSTRTTPLKIISIYFLISEQAQLL